MKINWGAGIVIAFVLFMGFILFFVFRVQTDHAYDNELVVEEYYKQERVLQADLDKRQNAVLLKDTVKIQNEAKAIRVTFPEGFDFKKIKGKVSLYRPSSQKLDFEFPLSLSASYLLIPKSDLAGGRWDITINWEYNGKGYITRERLTLN